jgi:hypothetical protein
MYCFFIQIGCFSGRLRKPYFSHTNKHLERRKTS